MYQGCSFSNHAKSLLRPTAAHSRHLSPYKISPRPVCRLLYILFQLFLQISRLIQCRVDIAEASRTIPSHFHHRQRFHQPAHRRIVIDIFMTIFRLGFRAICTPMLAA